MVDRAVMLVAFITGAVKPCPLGRGYKAYRAAMSFDT